MSSVTRRNRASDIRALLATIAGVNSSSDLPNESEYRLEERENRTVPVLLAPWVHGRPVMEEVTTAVSKNFSERGIGLVMHQPLRVQHVILGMLMFGDTPATAEGEPRFALGKVRQNVSIGGGYWQLGVEISELFPRERYKEVAAMLPLTSRLKPSDIAYKLPTADSCLHDA